MVPESCFGIDIADGKWLVAERRAGKTSYCGSFENNERGLTTLLQCIQTRATKPRVCIAPTGRAALALALHLCKIPEVEVTLLSAAGLRHHRARLPGFETRGAEGKLVPAEALARTAERMI